MVVNQKVTGTAASMPVGLTVGVLISVGMTLGGSMIAAWLVSAEKIPESGIGYAALVILLLSSALGALAAVKRIKRQRMVVCMLSGLCYYLVLLACTALFFGGQYSGMGVTALVVLAGAGTIGLLGLKGEGNNKKRRRKYASR